VTSLSSRIQAPHGGRLGAQARKAALGPFMRKLIRLGHIGRGILFAAIGLLSLLIALGRATDKAPDQGGALAAIASQSYGQALLLVVAVGLVGFALWGFIRAILDPLNRGMDRNAIIERIGFFVSGVSYGLLVMPTVQMVLGSGDGPRNQADSTRDMTAQLQAHPLGQWLVIVVGIVVLGWSIMQVHAALTCKFERDFDFSAMGAREEEFAEKVGQLGIVARAFVFALIGMFLIQAAIQQDAGQAKGLDAALLSLAQRPGGPVVLGLVALGLVVFGLYSMLCPHWLKVV
jgi:hypothetical protein